MEMRFEKHYTLEEARRLLPQVKQWLNKLAKLRAELEELDHVIASQMEEGVDTGGSAVNTWVKRLADVKMILLEFFRREIQVKDLDRGLIDFPGFVEGKEVFLCWEKGEKDIEFWHDLDAGYAGRRRLEG